LLDEIHRWITMRGVGRGVVLAARVRLVAVMGDSTAAVAMVRRLAGGLFASWAAGITKRARVCSD